MAFPCSVQDLLDSVGRSFAPFPVHGTTVAEDTIEGSEQTESDDRFFVQDIEFVADCPNRDTGSGAENRSLRC